ncbi:hypothetical protein RKE29_04465 [Streptomyces sp. B1866]|uniref:hypothetical protein n=1 Tax=Streptomyces sp. B1866 TaxID=3075431 RepID=UPI00288EC679|nr:hypothetical protein [Streptomyces sp. B1866]MDT3395903.1 hypothetical protein [Streptomyces sp. B1866]
MRLGALPGPRAQLRRIAEDLARGLNCVWVLPDRLVADGHADHLYDDLLASLPHPVSVPPPVPPPGPRPYDPPPPPAPPAADPFAAADGVPLLGDYDDGLGAAWPGAAPVPSRAAEPVPASVLVLPAQRPPVPACEPPSPLRRLAEAVAAPDGDAVGRLVAGSADRCPVVAVRGWREPVPAETARLLRVLSAAVKEAGLPPERRPRALLAVRLGDLPEALVDSLDASATAVHWWWSTLSRLDTAIVISEVRPPRAAEYPARGTGAVRQRIAAALRRETIAEVSGPDLALAGALAERWDGRLATLADTVLECVERLEGPDAPALRTVPADRGARAYGPDRPHGADGRCGTAHRAGHPAGSPSVGEPPPARPGAAVAAHPELALRAAWTAGAVDSWEGQLRLHAAGWAAKPEETLTKLVWQAQNRVLLPLLDDARARLAADLPTAAVHGPRRLAAAYGARRPPGVDGPAEAEGDPARRLAAMELGEMWAAVCRGEIRLDARARRALRRLRQARNRLAHRIPLDDEGLRGLCEALVG